MSLGTGLYSTGGGFSSFGSNFGFDKVDLFKPTASVLQAAKSEAVSTGREKNWIKALDFILKYGGAGLTILTTTGVIRNKNLSTVASAEYDRDALARLVDSNSGSIDRDPSSLTLPKSAGLSLDLSNPVVLLSIVAAIYLIFKR